MEISDDVIAERILVREQQPEKVVIVAINRPARMWDKSECRCVYQIRGAGHDLVGFGAGIDEFQALRAALCMLSADITRLNSTNATRLRWPAAPEITNCGFDED